MEALQEAIGTGSLDQAEMLGRLISRVAGLEAAAARCTTSWSSCAATCARARPAWVPDKVTNLGADAGRAAVSALAPRRRCAT